MIMGARVGVLAKAGPTAKDYVQDDLIAMWDGIENAGWGVHDQKATVWKDLIRGELLNIKSSTFLDDKLRISSKDNIPNKGEVTGEMIFHENESGYEFDIVSRLISINQTYQNCMFFSIGLWNKAIASSYRWTGAGAVFVNRIGSFDSFLNNSIEIGDGNTHLFSYIRSRDQLRVKHNTSDTGFLL